MILIGTVIARKRFDRPAKEGMMAISAPEQSEVFEKLITLARGDLELVQRAIWHASEHGKKRADLKKVVAYIEKYRKMQIRPKRESVAA